MNIWGLIASFAIISIWSFVFLDNQVYRIVQGLYLGMWGGIGLGNAVVLIIDNNVQPLIQGKTLLLVPLLLGMILYIRVFTSNRRYAWLSQITMGLVIGVGTAVATYGAINGQLVAQLRPVVTSLVISRPDGSLNVPAILNQIIIVFGMLAVFAYFMFSKISERAVIRGANRVGRYVLMLSFGVTFGNVVIGRITSFMEALSTILRGLGLG